MTWSRLIYIEFRLAARMYSSDIIISTYWFADFSATIRDFDLLISLIIWWFSYPLVIRPRFRGQLQINRSLSSAIAGRPVSACQPWFAERSVHVASGTRCAQHGLCQARGASSIGCVRHEVRPAWVVSGTRCVQHGLCQARGASSTGCVRHEVRPAWVVSGTRIPYCG